LKTRSGGSYDKIVIQGDDRALDTANRYWEVRVRAEETEQARRVIFEVVDSPRLASRNPHDCLGTSGWIGRCFGAVARKVHAKGCPVQRQD
jgi:hypothetical protein